MFLFFKCVIFLFIAESSETLPIIVGSAAASGLTLVVVVVVIVFLFRRFTNTGKQSLLLIFWSNILQYEF